MKGNELKNKGIKFILGEKEYELKLNMNTLLYVRAAFF